MTKTKTKTKLKKKGHKDGSRRYEEGVFPTYDQTYSKLAKNSVILNDRKRKDDFSYAGSLFDIGNCKGALAQIIGTPDSSDPDRRAFYRENGNLRKALLPIARTQLRQVHKKHQNWQQEQVQKGLTLKPPKEWPEDLLKERVAAQAQLDVRRAERHKIEKRIEELREKQGLNKTEPVLPEGPVGIGLNHDQRSNSEWLIDGQPVSYKNGVPFIDCADSPYDRMPVATYRQMSKAWLKENQISQMALISRRNAYVKKLKEQDEEIPPNLSWKKYKAMLKRNDKWPENPPWPDNAKTIDELEDA